MKTKVNTPSILIIFGATGDLMARKLLPALVSMYQQQLQPKYFTVLGFARNEMTNAAFQDKLTVNLARHHPEVVATVPNDFYSNFQYQAGNFDDPTSYKELAERIKRIEDEWGVCTNKLFYFAVAPQYYPTIFDNLASVGLNTGCDDRYGWTRLMVEKPFGNSLSEAKLIEAKLHDHFKDEQVYMVDHYLAKEVVQGILSFRFANSFLQSSWDHSSVEQVEVNLFEQIDIEGRGLFYEKVGALLDVGQNHAMELLALATMDQPTDFTAKSIRKSRADILQKLECASEAQRAQYQGYLHEDAVAEDSIVETFFEIDFQLNHPAWQGVPITIRGGKATGSNKKEIILTYKSPSQNLFENEQKYKNEIRISLGSDPGITILFWHKKQGTERELIQQTLKFAYDPESKERYQAEYVTLLTNALNGDQTLFVSLDEAMASWKIIDPILAKWHNNGDGLVAYAKDTLPTLTTHSEQSNSRGCVGVVGLGKMGLGIARQLSEKGWTVNGYDPDVPKDLDIPTTSSYQSLADSQSAPRLIWLMIPHTAVDEALFSETGLMRYLQPGDVIIDGGNSRYTDSIRRAEQLAEHGISFMDVGYSGGPSGARNGGSLMIGGKTEDYNTYKQLFIDLAVRDGYQFFEGVGAGHFVKMVHNGIEYGMMQSIAEGFDIMHRSAYNLDLAAVTNVYNHGSVIESKLVAWLQNAFAVYGQELEGVSGSVASTGEGAWTVDAANELGAEAWAIKAALDYRIKSEHDPTYAGQLLSALRQQFGGHAIK